MIDNILNNQNEHWHGGVYPSVQREQLKQFIEYLPLKQIITISGVRRCGKSTLAKQVINHLIETGTSAKNILFINLEQPFFIEYRHDSNYLNTLYEAYIKLINPKGKVTIIFDEIQFFENWQVYLKSKYENSYIKFIITGSNSSMLSNEMNTLLSGRSLNIHLNTFSFREFLDYKGIAYKEPLERLENKIDIERAKDEYLKWGGFYEVFDVESEQTKKEILISYARSIIYQDIIPRYKIRNAELVERLFFYLLSHAGGVLNYTNLSKTFGVSDKSIKEYINHFEDVFLFQRIDKYHNKPKERIKSSKKLYVLDNGFLQIVPKNSENKGVSLENLVFINLYAKDNTLTYLKDKYEVDFYTKGDYYQVAYDISDPKTLKRELNAFKYFDISEENHVEQKRRLISYSENKVTNDVEIISFESLLLN